MKPNIEIRKFIVLTVLAVVVYACDVRPAEEYVEDTGAANFVASFEVAAGVAAPWDADDKLVVIDSDNISHKFGLDMGATKNEGEFSGNISPKSTIKYVVYSSDSDNVIYNPETSEFAMTVPSSYTAKAAGSLVTANNAAIGVLMGSEVALKSVCGFVKFTVESNGQTLEQDGVIYELTDLKKVSFVSNEGKAFAGNIVARWTEGDTAPSYVSVENGASEISFRTRTIYTPEGHICYQAGDYYIPVIPQSYEDVTITVEDSDGKTAVAVKNRAIDVHAAMQSNLNIISWPTVVITVNLYSNSLTESQQHPAHTFPSVNLSVPRVSQTNQQVVAGASKKQEAVDMKEGDVTYQIWATNGYAKWTQSMGGSNCLTDITFNNYTPSWSYGGDVWTVGSPNGYAWVKIPGSNGILYKMEVEIMSYSKGPLCISEEVDSVTGQSISDIETFTTTGAMETYTAVIPKREPGTPFYICMGNGYGYRLRKWTMYYKIYD